MLKIVDINSLILREASALSDGTLWIVISGSPCQDLTYAGPYQGLLGLTGKRSVYFFITQHVIWWLSKKFGRRNVRFICENAGSMQGRHRHIMLWSLGLSPTLPVKRTYMGSMSAILRKEMPIFLQKYYNAKHY